MQHPVRAGDGLMRRLAGDRRGNFAVMTALTAPVALLLTAFAVDEGSLFTERREAQALADLAAIAAAANIGKAEAAALATLKANGMAALTLRGSGDPLDVTGGKVSVKVVRGRYITGPGTSAGQRFSATADPPFNAVEVSMHKTGTLFFGGAFMDPPVIGVKAVAAATPQAAFSIGSRLADVDTKESPLLNSLLGGLLGMSISLQAMDYKALLNTDIEVLAFLDVLATRLNLTAASYSDVLATQATVGQIAAAMAHVPGLDSTSRLALETLAANASATAAIPLTKLVDLGNVGKLALGQKPPGLVVAAGALDMLMAAAVMANGSRQIDLGTGIALPPLANMQLKVAVGEPPQSSPWFRVGQQGALVRTAQTRIKLTADVAIGNSNPVAGLNLASVSLPINVELAYGEAEITDISCPTGRPESRKVTIAARPGIASLKLARNDSANFGDFTRPQSFGDAQIAKAAVELKLLGITVLKLPLVEVSGRSEVDIGNTAKQTLVFNDADIAAKKIKTVTTSDYTQSLTTSLLDRLDLHVSAVGLPLNFLDDVLNLVKPPVIAVLRTATAPVDKLLYNLLKTLGIGLGQADVRVTGATCGRSVLVQ